MPNDTKKQKLIADLKLLAQRVTARTGTLDERVSDLEDLAAALLLITNSIIANIERKE